MRIPAKAALHVLAAHRLVAPHHVLDVAGQQVAVVRQAVGKWRAVIENELVGAVGAGGTVVNRCLEGAVLFPIRQHLLFHLRE